VRDSANAAARVECRDRQQGAARTNPHGGSLHLGALEEVGPDSVDDKAAGDE
jgi:hypothetical protein